MRYASGDPWPPAERKARKAAGRPCCTTDELTQVINKVVNGVRQSKRAVNVVPRGFGANDETATLRGDLIREIEYKSNAQSAYACGFENMCMRSYGGWRISRQYVSEKSFDQELVIKRIPNPNSSLPDPDCKEADYSDAKYWFLLDSIPRKEYKRKYPKAKIVDFNAEQLATASKWITESQVIVAEYWRVEEEKRTLLHVKPLKGETGQPIPMFEDELPEKYDLAQLRKDGHILAERESTKREIVQYITNGLEILERNPQPGKYIPIVWLTGRELYIDNGGVPKRVLMSLIRLARDPQMMMNYASTLEMELLGMTPKTPYIGATGQFQNPEIWEALSTTPKAFAEYNAKTTPTGDSVLPPPQRPAYEPQVEPCEIAKESARRSVQSATGLSPLPTNAQKLNDKSGVALKQIDTNEDRGSFHFIDNYEMGIEHNGRILNDLIQYTYDGAREIGVRNAKDEHRSVKVNQPTQNEKGETVSNDMTSGDHEVTISTGPSDQSEREAADEFVKVIVPELESLELPPQTKAKLLAYLVKAQNIGPMGQEIAKLLDPPDDTANKMQSLQQQAAQSTQMLAEQQTEIQNLQIKEKAHVIDNEYMLKKSQMDNELKLAIAEITTKAQDAQARASLTQDLLKELHVAAHDAAKQAVEHAHKHSLADKQAANAQESQSAQQAHEAEMAANSEASKSASGD